MIIIILNSRHIFMYKKKLELPVAMSHLHTGTDRPLGKDPSPWLVVPGKVFDAMRLT